METPFQEHAWIALKDVPSVPQKNFASSVVKAIKRMTLSNARLVLRTALNVAKECVINV